MQAAIPVYPATTTYYCPPPSPTSPLAPLLLGLECYNWQPHLHPLSTTARHCPLLRTTCQLSPTLVPTSTVPCVLSWIAWMAWIAYYGISSPFSQSHTTHTDIPTPTPTRHPPTIHHPPHTHTHLNTEASEKRAETGWREKEGVYLSGYVCRVLTIVLPTPANRNSGLSQLSVLPTSCSQTHPAVCFFAHPPTEPSLVFPAVMVVLSLSHNTPTTTATATAATPTSPLSHRSSVISHQPSRLQYSQ